MYTQTRASRKTARQNILNVEGHNIHMSIGSLYTYLVVSAAFTDAEIVVYILKICSNPFVADERQMDQQWRRLTCIPNVVIVLEFMNLFRPRIS